MPRKARERKALQVARLNKPGFHAVGGVAGLLLRVSETRSRSWILRAMVGGRRRDMGLGGFPDVPLADARTRAREFRVKIDSGVDPVEERRARKAEAVAVLTFDQAARRLIEVKTPEWKNAKHRAQWEATLRTYASPVIGKMPVDKIALSQIVEILSPLWTTKTETATRLRSRIEAVLSWATASGHRTGDNPARWRGNLDAGILAKPGKLKNVKHHAAMAIDSLPEFFALLHSQSGTAARALEYLILTAARSGEVRGARWDEIDFDAATWTIPASRMKAGKEHAVPLTKAAIDLLKRLPRFENDDVVFAAPRGGKLSDMTLTAVTRRMKVDAVPHGFRSTFKDWCSERTNYPREVSEMALAHTIGDKVEAAFRRGDLLAKRTKMMAEWAKFLVTSRSVAENVTPLNGRRRAR
jgi:integrase